MSRSSVGGFTLLEVVAALALTGLVLLVLVGAQFGAARSVAALGAADLQLRDRALYRRLRSDLESTYLSHRAGLPAFAGEGDRLAFLSRRGPTGLERVQYQSEPEALIRLARPWSPARAEGAPEDAASGERRSTWPAAGRPAFRYLSPAGLWAGRWSSEVEDRLPVAVEVRLGDEVWVYPVHTRAGLPEEGGR